ncbi:hypothetical protein Cob_v005327 [Colletotrichum orbiculare MAFF 240422]|uniref:Uncharacterized protein n=1 Tax=Colletotrichum orbiculare (strain 104-T / ATCC 96160 / CBS 514.97 / LARS 414 / MAFF 240422) TaxID=1213857 RepID=A0A484FUR0_COLOR|nr:hypothetical protein Cob_v005327 [Colletotrichum orbiculare MAFF 240422]
MDREPEQANGEQHLFNYLQSNPHKQDRSRPDDGVWAAMHGPTNTQKPRMLESILPVTEPVEGYCTLWTSWG